MFLNTILTPDETIMDGLIPKGIILNKLNIDNQAVTYHFNFIFKGDQYIIQGSFTKKNEEAAFDISTFSKEEFPQKIAGQYHKQRFVLYLHIALLFTRKNIHIHFLYH